MIPLVGESAVLPHVETTCLKQNSIALTFVQAQNQLTSISSPPTINNSFSPGIRILQSRTQRRRSSVSSLCSLLKFEDDELRKLSSRGSSVGELRLCAETKQLSSKQSECNENLGNNVCLSSEIKEDKDEETEYGSNSKRMMSTVSTDNTSLDVQNKAEAKNEKFKSRSNCRAKSKKHSKSKKSPKIKGNGKTSSKGPSVFERLANVTKNCNNQDKFATSPKYSTIRKNSTIFYNRSSGNLLEIKRLQATYMPVLKSSQPKTSLSLPRVTMSTTSNRTTSPSPRQKSCHSISTISNNITIISPRKSLDNILKYDNHSTKKVYLSEVQSKMVGGVPGAPPVTPFPEEQTRIEYIPCLMDIKSQRAVKSKLEKIVTKLKSEEKQQKENAIKENQRRLKESLLQLKQQQRAEIYTLNKVMTELENQKFKRFMMKKDAVSTMGV